MTTGDGSSSSSSSRAGRSHEYSAEALRTTGVAVPLLRGEGTLRIQLLHVAASSSSSSSSGSGSGSIPVAAERAALRAAEVAQGALASAYAALQSAPLSPTGVVAPRVTALAVGYTRAYTELYREGKYAEAAAEAQKVVDALKPKDHSGPPTSKQQRSGRKKLQQPASPGWGE
eukprot:COSAG06_NODE_71_length_25945_cov_9.124468_1_plen_173_part_00